MKIDGTMARMLDLEGYNGDGMMGGRVMGCAMGVHHSLLTMRTMMLQEEEQQGDKDIVFNIDGLMVRL